MIFSEHLKRTRIIFCGSLVILGFLYLLSGTISKRQIMSKNPTDFLTPNKSSQVDDLRNLRVDIEVSQKKCGRRKRFLIFENGGVVKLVLGVSFPIHLADRVRSLNYFYNLQLQYTPPLRPIYWWSIFNSNSFPVASRRARQSAILQMERDISREYIYAAIEVAYESAGLPGAQCLLQTICEIAHSPFYVPKNKETRTNRDIFHELLNTIFLPIYPNVSLKYLHAYNVGSIGADCQYECPQLKTWLRRYSASV